MCPGCCEEIVLLNCDYVKSKVISRGASHSRKQPALNLQIVQCMTEAGVNTLKTQEFLTEGLRIKVANDKNLQDQQSKVRAAIGVTFEKRKDENRKKAVEARQAMSNGEQIRWSNGGAAHMTT